MEERRSEFSTLGKTSVFSPGLPRTQSKINLDYLKSSVFFCVSLPVTLTTVTMI